MSFIQGEIPSGAAPLRTQDSRPVEVKQRDRLAELIAVPALTWQTALLGLLIAAMLGGLHALSPGHGKVVVGAYLIGSRGTGRHAAFLGPTVTVTHTAGVFALGLVLAFSAGLAGALTCVGLLFIHARRFVERPAFGGAGLLVRAMPVSSALVITCAGAAICYGAIAQQEVNLPQLVASLRLRMTS